MNYKCLNREDCTQGVKCEGANKIFLQDCPEYELNEDFEDHDLYYGKLKDCQRSIKRTLAVYGVEIGLREDGSAHLFIRHSTTGKHGYYDIKL